MESPTATGFALCYHSLFGNLYLLQPEYTAVLDIFSTETPANLTSKQQAIASELAEASFLVNNGSNEREKIEARNQAWVRNIANGGQLRYLNLMVSEACNFGCQHCLHKCSVATTTTHGQKKLMDKETALYAFDAYAAVMARNVQDPLNVHFGSAEPLLNWPVVRSVVEYGHSIADDCVFALNTNLSLLTKEMAEFFRDHSVSISTSLDGPQPGNDAIRTFHDGRGTFEEIMSRFDLLARVGYPLDGFSITINDLNFDFVTPEFIMWAHDQGFKGIATDIDLINNDNASRSVSECVDKLTELWDCCEAHGIENFGSWTTAYHNMVCPPEDGMTAFCKAIKGKNISVNPEGHLFLCGHTTTTFGKLDQLDSLFIPGSEYSRLIESRLPGNDPACKGCPIEGCCAGQCHITREVSKSTGNGRDNLLCDFYRLATAKLLERRLENECAISARRG